MASSERVFCTLCCDDGTSKDAVTWCTKCEVFLCTECEKHHKKSRMSKDHKTMSIKDYHKLPTFMQEVSSLCKDHKKKFKVYCSFHACLCCVQCVTNKHQKCSEMKSLPDILKQIKSSASVQLLEQDLKDVKENFDEVMKYLKSRLNTSNTQKLKAAETIRSIKKSIDEFLNKIEQEILDDLETKHSKLKSDLNTLLQQLEQRANQISQLQSGFSEMTQLATELQMYVGLREIEKTTSKAATYIEALKNGESFGEKNLEVSISPSFLSILQDVKSFGDIDINTSQSTLRLNAGRKDQAQYLVPTVLAIDEIKPSMLRTLTIPENMKSIRIFACRILPDGKYLILHNDGVNGHLMLFRNDGIFIRTIVTFTGFSYDACFVRNNTVAVALGSAYTTKLVNIEKNKTYKTINLSHSCFAVECNGQILVISCREKSTIVHLNDESHSILEKVGADRIALFKENIYGTNRKEVCCYTSTGEPLWTFQHHDIFNPQGLALDKNGFVYIASRGNNIMVVSPDGKTSKTILSEADGIKHPIAIDINRETGMMIVSSDINDGERFYQSAFLYKI